MWKGGGGKKRALVYILKGDGGCAIYIYNVLNSWKDFLSSLICIQYFIIHSDNVYTIARTVLHIIHL